MTISPLAGKPAPKELLVDIARLEREYFERCLNELFDVSRSETLESGTRTLYYALARAPS